MRSPILSDVRKVNQPNWRSMNLRLISKKPYKTWSLEVKHAATDEKQYSVIAKQLLSIGWIIDPIDAAPFHGTYSDTFTRDGEEANGEWTTAEAPQNLAALYRLLNRFNYPKPRQHRLTRMEQE